MSFDARAGTWFELTALRPRNQPLGTRPYDQALILPPISEEGYLDDRRVLVLRLSRADSERCTAETDHDEIVKVMVGAETAAA